MRQRKIKEIKESEEITLTITKKEYKQVIETLFESTKNLEKLFYKLPKLPESVRNENNEMVVMDYRKNCMNIIGRLIDITKIIIK